MEVIAIEQGTKEWHDLRLGKVTGTKFEKIMGTSLARVQLASELIAEEATEQSKLVRATEEMERGNHEEEFAIKLFEEQTGKKFVRGGAWLSSEYEYLMCSPDAALEPDENGDILEAVEVKNPDSKTAIFYRLSSMISAEALGLPKSKVPFLGIPEDYKWQCVNYFINNRKLQKLHFLIHDARFIDPKVKLTVVTLNRENEVLQEAIKQAETALQLFREDWLTWKDIVLPVDF